MYLLRVAWNVGLNPFSQPGLGEYEILHQAQNRSAQRIVLTNAVNHGSGRYTGTANAVRALLTADLTRLRVLRLRSVRLCV